MKRVVLPPAQKPETTAARYRVKAAPYLLHHLFFGVVVVISLFVILVQIWGCGLTSSGDSQNLTSGGSSMNSISDLKVGDTQVINFANGQAVLDFSNVDANRNYVIALTGGLGGSSFTVTSGGDTTTASRNTSNVPTNTQPSNRDNGIQPNGNTASDPHLWFRRQEAEFFSQHSAPIIPNEGPVESGSSLTSFNVLTSTNGTYTTISAALLISGTHVNLFEDTSTPTTLTVSEIASLKSTLDALYQKMTSNFGEPSDIDHNGKIDVVLTPTLSNFGNNSPLSGYFWAGDLHSTSQYPGSNQKEVIFLIAPDVTSFYGGVIPIVDVLNTTLPGIFAHETQHLLNFLHKTSAENATINEGLSHVVEDWSGYPTELRYKQADCLNGLLSANLDNDNTDLPARGCAELVLQHLCESKGDVGTCLASIVTSPNTGWGNIEQITGESMGVSIVKAVAGFYLTGNSSVTSTSELLYNPQGVGPAGDVTGFNGYETYNDFRGTMMNGPQMGEPVTQLPATRALFGVADLFQFNTSTLSATQISLSQSGMGSIQPAAVLIRVND